LPADVLRFDPDDPTWSSVESATEDPHRVRRALQLFATKVLIPSSLRPAAEILAWAAGTTRDAASTEGLVTPIQGARALLALARMTPSSRAVLDELLGHAGSRAEQALLLKLVAARAQQPSLVDDLRALATKIRGKPLRWLVENTTPYGSSFGAGIKQSYKDSCMPAIKLLAEAEVDPLFALDMREGATLASEEKRELESEGGVAVARDDFEHGRGTRDHELLFTLGKELDEQTEVLSRADMDETTVDRMAQLLEEGVDIPLRIATAADTVAHSVIAVDVRKDGDERWFRVHDPWTGSSEWFPAEAILHGNLFPTDRGVARHVTHVYLLQPT
jgi:hypothetical protein